MIGTIVNAIAIVVGALVGVLFRTGFSERTKDTVFTAAGFVTVVVGAQMALKTGHVLALAIALILGGILGTKLDIEGAVLGLGESLKRRFAGTEENSTFASGFLTASVLFCVGAMALVGSFKAGTEGDYTILFTKSVLDGFLAMMFAGAMGIGVAFSALSVLVYQGILTLLSVWIKPWVSPVMLNELTGVGGVLVLMISCNLLKIKTIRTGDFLPAVVFSACLVPLFPFVSFL